jgi:pantetheine-phosphate adenylyltransferase
MAIALFPGSFDPITTGHVDIIVRALPLFEKIIIGIGNNADKKYMFPIEKRKQWIEKTFSNEKRIEVMPYEGLTVSFCKKAGAGFLLRGLRTAADFEFEKAIANMNRAMNPEIETVLILASPALSSVSSSIVRDIIRNGGNVKQFVAKGVDL